MSYKSNLLNSLETVFLDSTIKNDSLNDIKIFVNEEAFFQHALKPEYESNEANGWDDGIKI
jgi:hypothetical protein